MTQLVVYGLEGMVRRSQAYALLAAAAQEHWGLASLPVIDRGAWGKPFFPDCPQYHFSLSHSGSFALCALNDCPVGVDIQVIKPRRPGFLDRVLSQKEREWLRQNGDDMGAFTLLWTLKESACKYTGRGLTQPVSEIRIPLPEHGGTGAGWETLTQDGVSFSCFSGPSWRAAACGAQLEGTIRWQTIP